MSNQTTRQVFKIRNAQGLFSTGGSFPNFTAKGKTWTSLGALSNHLAILGHRGEESYKKQRCEVVTYEVIEREGPAESIESCIAAKRQRAADRQAAQRKRWDAWVREQELHELVRLKARYEP